MPAQLRIARPVTDLAESVAMYKRGLGLEVIGSFENHDRFDGTNEDLLVFYFPEAEAWEKRCIGMLEAGFKEVPSFKPI